MASKKALAIKQAEKDAAQEARFLRLELIILALAEAAGIDVDQVLVDAEEIVEDEPQEDEADEEEIPGEEEPVKAKKSRKRKPLAIELPEE